MGSEKGTCLRTFTWSSMRMTHVQMCAFTFAKQQLCVFTLCACFEGMLWKGCCVHRRPRSSSLRLIVYNEQFRPKGPCLYRFIINLYMSTFIYEHIIYVYVSYGYVICIHVFLVARFLWRAHPSSTMTTVSRN